MSTQLAKPWITIIGLGADGVKSISTRAQNLINNADIIIASPRLAEMINQSKAQIHHWPTPFDPIVEKIKSWKGQAIVMLATGDPMWFGAGSTLCRHFAPTELEIIPSPSAFSLAAARMGWPLAQIETLSLHGRPSALIAPFIQPDAKFLALTSGSQTIHEVAKRLIDQGFGNSQMHVLENMGGAQEQRFNFAAQDIPHKEFSPFNTLAVECVVNNNAIILPRTAGLPDTAFVHDGQLTKQHVRAITGCALSPRPNQLLWDVGSGCGSIAIEWMRHHLSNRAIAFENNDARVELINQNADRLGTPYLKVINGNAPDSFKGQSSPDAVFIGGGVTIDGLFEATWSALKSNGILVANAVTSDSRAYITSLQSTYGGTLTDIAISSLGKIGTKKTMRPALPVLQWRVTKP